MEKYLEDLKIETDFIDTWLNNLDIEISSLNFDENDIRKNYFQMCYNNVKEYKISYTSFIISYLLNTDMLVPNHKIKRALSFHFMNIQALTKSEINQNSYFNSLNHRVFIMAWSIFELSMTTIFEVLCPENEKNKYCNKTYNDIKSKIINDKRSSVENTLKIKYSQLLSTPIKYNYLFKISKGYSGILNEDKAFLEFMGKFRNTMHSNFIYYGKDYDYYFGHAHFKFENKKIVEWSNPFQKSKSFPSVKLYIHLIGRLNEIVFNIIKSIPYDNTIYYPDLRQP